LILITSVLGVIWHRNSHTFGDDARWVKSDRHCHPSLCAQQVAGALVPKDRVQHIQKRKKPGLTGNTIQTHAAYPSARAGKNSNRVWIVKEDTTALPQGIHVPSWLINRRRVIAAHEHSATHGAYCSALWRNGGSNDHWSNGGCVRNALPCREVLHVSWVVVDQREPPASFSSRIRTRRQPVHGP
jgi:hypothetical protein